MDRGAGRRGRVVSGAGAGVDRGGLHLSATRGVVGRTARSARFFPPAEMKTCSPAERALCRARCRPMAKIQSCAFGGGVSGGGFSLRRSCLSHTAKTRAGCPAAVAFHRQPGRSMNLAVGRCCFPPAARPLFLAKPPRSPSPARDSFGGLRPIQNPAGAGVGSLFAEDRPCRCLTSLGACGGPCKAKARGRL